MSNREAPAASERPLPLNDDELKDLAYSAHEEAMSFGLSVDTFMRYFKTVRDRAASAPQAVRMLTEEEREHIHQAIEMLGDYEVIQRELGNNSVSSGAGATRYVLGRLFRFLPSNTPAAAPIKAERELLQRAWGWMADNESDIFAASESAWKQMTLIALDIRAALERAQPADSANRLRQEGM